MRIQNPTIYKQAPLTPQFRSNRNLTPPQDEFISSYISKVITNEKGKLKAIIYKTPLPFLKIFKNMENPKDVFAKERFYTHLHSEEEIRRISEALKYNKEIGSTAVKALIGFGAFAFAFETEDGLVLKITEGEHFPYGRKPADFDLPVIKCGKISPNDRLYYYLEEKVRQDNLEDVEIVKLIRYIKSKGYSMRDYLKDFAEPDDPHAEIKQKQFGRAPDGKIYLIDPGCAYLQTEEKTGFFKRILEKIRNR